MSTHSDSTASFTVDKYTVPLTGLYVAILSHRGVNKHLAASLEHNYSSLRYEKIVVIMHMLCSLSRRMKNNLEH